ncbi:pilus assembly protein [Burkholderia mayonis]|uniref:Pilus assembly protein n=1 Tax=Burkholderia mayonis TaxID=1385591 RepID=A0A1B4FJ97_9BURK|nr:fimbrial protein [Burkholderia mayonis]AOJ03759.1 pilus assembly protein [Burkholderia mayonis]KVE44252.1 pilus assembly protein [Burkholderia mayonis]
MQLKRVWRARFRDSSGTRTAARCVWIAVAALPIGAQAATCEGDKTLATLPAITVASDAPVGTVLWSQKGIAFSTYCKLILIDTSNIYLWRADLSSTLQQYGLTFWLTYEGQGGNTAQQIKSPMVVDLGGKNGYASGAVDLELRKTGVTPAQGAVSAADIPAFYLDSNTNNRKGSHYIRGLTNISFVSYTCDIDTGSRSMNVPLGDVRVDRFSGIGSTYGDQNFNIGLTCTQPAGTYNVALTFSATADSTGASGVLALTQRSDVASGVGIQLLMGGAPVTFGTALDAGSATAGTTLTIPMTARYYQTGGMVTPGAANGIATFTISYK